VKTGPKPVRDEIAQFQFGTVPDPGLDPGLFPVGFPVEFLVQFPV
jgi:hypothetical protein